MKRAFLAAAAAALLLHLADDRLGAQGTDDLKFFKNFFVTGDYYIAGVGLKAIVPVGGLSTGSISVLEKTETTNGVPRGADILAAYLYWQVVSDTGPDAGSLGVKFKGFDLTLPDDLTTAGIDPKPFGKLLASAGTAACFNPGGGTGDNGSARKTFTYRMDVLRFFGVEGPGTPTAPNPFAGKTAIIGSHPISVPNFGGTSNQAPIALGASLMIIYRDPTKPLKAIVIYDDGVTLGNAQRTLIQPIAGFYQPYQPDPAIPTASISYIVGSGDPTKNEMVSFPNGSAMNPFSGSAGTAWDNRTYPVNLGGGADASNLQSITTTVTNDIGQRDCLTVAAIVFQTAVLDTDNDGLLDKWETATTPLSDPNGKPLPLLSAMGAESDHKDAFIEVGYMDTGGVPLSYGGETRVAHSHRPTHEVLKLVGDTFKNAPVVNPDGTTGINVHFDVGTDYPACPDSGPCASEYIIPGDDPSLARGGERMDERAVAGEVAGDGIQGCVREDGDLPWVCQYSNFPGTVGWKTGYRFIRDAVTLVNDETPPFTYNEDLCGTAGNNCRYRFDPNRRDMFRYVFFAHALGIPQSPEIYNSDGTENSLFHTPITNTGIADFRGGDVMLTLGAFLDHDNVSPVGTPFQQASTLVHELGHTMARRHNGDTLEPNCTPQYLSSMNYLYQLRGLIGADGLPRIALSSNAQTSVFNELHLDDGMSGVNSTFRMSWYAPIVAGEPLAAKPGVTPAKRHCDGSLIPVTIPPIQYVRVDTGNLEAVDWKANNTTDLDFAQDINFNGVPETLTGSTDWDKLELNQIGSRRSPGGYFYDLMGELTIGPLSLGGGKGDLGSGDLSEYALGGGKGDLGGGKGDLGGGKGDLGGGKGDLGGGKGDLGVGTRDLLGGGKGDLGGGKGDLGLGDEGGGDTFGDEGEIDETLASDLTRVPPNQVTAVQIESPENYVQLSWVAPNVGGILRYTAYRSLIDATTGQTGAWTKLLTPGIVDPPGTVEVPAGVQYNQANRAFSWTDPDSHRLVKGSKYAYQVTATYNVKNPLTGLYEALESNGSSPDAVVGDPAPPGIANNDPTFTNIASLVPQNILRGTNTAVLQFTVNDTESPLDDLVVVATKPNTPLANELNVVVGGSGANRTVQVFHTVPLSSNFGTVTIQLTLKDTQCTDPNDLRNPCPSGSTTTSFTVSVFRYAMLGVTNVPPAVVASVQRGRNITFEWRYTDGATTTVVDSPTVIHQVVVTGPPNVNNVPTTRNYTSGFQYQSNTRTWRFTLTTKDGNVAFPAGTFGVTIKSTTPLGYSPKTFPLVVTP